MENFYVPGLASSRREHISIFNELKNPVSIFDEEKNLSTEQPYRIYAGKHYKIYYLVECVLSLDGVSERDESGIHIVSGRHENIFYNNTLRTLINMEEREYMLEIGVALDYLCDKSKTVKSKAELQEIRIKEDKIVNLLLKGTKDRDVLKTILNKEEYEKVKSVAKKYENREMEHSERTMSRKLFRHDRTM